ncbi:hypothetical protein [Candidatus Oleimmundimicrobium sp.]|nr:hypothetical protein [Candidatus Oleimmundimicrobium sp.]MDO8886639.1 hypothetical protein [Candidatus Oleimmundimicrobium sp.]
MSQTIAGLVLIFIIGIVVMFGARYLFMRSMEKSSKERQEKERDKT